MTGKDAIKLKLETAIMPYIIIVENLQKGTKQTLYNVYNYSKETLSALAGFGISSPVFKFADGGLSVQNLTNSNISLGIAGLVAGVLIIIFKNHVGKEEYSRIIIGQKKVMRQFKAYRAQVQTALGKQTAKEVITDLIRIQQDIITNINNAIQEDIISDSTFSNEVMELSREQTSKLIDLFRNNWEPVNEGGELPEQIA